MIELTSEEKNILWYSLATAKMYYEENHQPEIAKNTFTLLRLLNLSDRVTFEISKYLTEDGIKELQLLQINRKTKKGGGETKCLTIASAILTTPNSQKYTTKVCTGHERHINAANAAGKSNRAKNITDLKANG